MQSLETLFQTFEMKDLVLKPRTKKDLYDMFFEELKKCHKEDSEKEKELAYNQGRKAKIYPVIRYPVMVMRLKAMNLAELEWFLAYCKESKHFAKCFYYKTKII
jgi:hypothetical protein